MLRRLDELSAYQYYAQISLTPYETDVEVNLRPKRDIIKTIQELARRIGKERVVWRYDPILLNESYPIDCHLEWFEKALEELASYTERCIISFIDMYAKAKKNTQGLEYADYYRAGALKKQSATENVDENSKSPWMGEVPELSVYDWRGCRMLDTRTYKGKCFTCKWACMANVTIEYDWGNTQKFRFESFCYGPKNCKLYKMGKPRAVPYKGDSPNYDEGWLDDICTENRGDDD